MTARVFLLEQGDQPFALDLPRNDVGEQLQALQRPWRELHLAAICGAQRAVKRAVCNVDRGAGVGFDAQCPGRSTVAPGLGDGVVEGAMLLQRPFA